MIKKQVSFFIAFVIPLFAEPRFPDEFTVVERFLSLMSTFDIETDLGPYAQARKRLLSFTSDFDFVDSCGRPMAYSQSRFFTWGTTADLFDPEGNKIGWIEEVIWRIFPWGEYKVFDADNKQIAVARMNFWGTYFNLFPPDIPTHIYATIARPFIRFFRDHWTVQVLDYPIFDEKKIDPRLLILLAIYQTDKDNRDRLRREIIDQLRSEQEQFEGTRQ